MIKKTVQAIAFLGIILSTTAHADIIYDVNLANGAAVGAGTVTFNDAAFDSDGVFDISGGVTAYSITFASIAQTFTLADQALTANLDYRVIGGLLVGFDWFANNGSHALFNHNSGSFTATPITSTV
jgi:hypothetical protein